MKNLHRVFVIIIFVSSMFIVANAQKLSGGWTLAEAKQNGEAVSLWSENPTNLIFGGKNLISGNGGCNHYSGDYKISGKNFIKFGRVISTMMACRKNDVMNQERAFFDVMRKIERFERKGNNLIFFDAAKRNVLRFTRGAKQKQ